MPELWGEYEQQGKFESFCQDVMLFPYKFYGILLLKFIGILAACGITIAGIFYMLGY
jgi:hypothetical protein